eukprot:832067-Amphidinium_carterae.2
MTGSSTVSLAPYTKGCLIRRTSEAAGSCAPGATLTYCSSNRYYGVHRGESIKMSERTVAHASAQ